MSEYLSVECPNCKENVQAPHDVSFRSGDKKANVQYSNHFTHCGKCGNFLIRWHGESEWEVLTAKAFLGLSPEEKMMMQGVFTNAQVAQEVCWCFSCQIEERVKQRTEAKKLEDESSLSG